MHSIRYVLLACVAVLTLGGCDRARKVEGGGLGVNCTMCHGNPLASFDPAHDLTNAAPPVGTRGGTQITDLDVGQHQAHLNAGAFALAFACATCHTVPKNLVHIGEPVVVIVRGAGQALLAANLGTYDPTTHTCSVYCHGRDIAGGTAGTKPPSWTQSFSNCDACHGLPPSLRHPALASSDLTTCATCHPATMNPDGRLNVAGGKHVNGHIDVVGGHPADYADPTSPAFHGSDALAFLEQQGGATDCSSCHGADLNGSSGPSCGGCHATRLTTSFPAGVSDWKTNCTFCHGTPTEPFSYASQLTLAAPPDDVTGRLTGASTAAKTGAHQLHLTGSAVALAFSCATCHSVPTQGSTSLDHLVGGTAQVAFSGIASGGTYSGGTCAAYCHKPTTIASGTVGGSTPSWSGSGYACNACHGNTSDSRNYWPATGQHARHCASSQLNLRCIYCHAGVVTDVDATTTPGIASPTLHVNGVENVQFGGTRNGNPVSGTWNSSNRSCNPSCHGGETW